MNASDPATALPETMQQEGLRSTRAIVDLDVIEHNVRLVRQSLTPGTHLIAVVKANGYGHGALFVAKSAIAAGASMLAVALVSEGVILRRNGILAPILVLGAIDPSEYVIAIENGLTLALGSFEAVNAVNAWADESGRTAHVHLKIDTGMHRYGCAPEDAVAIARAITASRNLWLEGVFTHFACADESDEAPTLAQTALFDQCLSEIASAGISVQVKHAANSAAALRSRRYDYDAIRLGIALYGIAPSDDAALLPGMKPAMRMSSRVTRLFDLQPGDRVSYGGTYVADRIERVALIPCGYADGYRRSLSNVGTLAHGDKPLTVRGRVCMDQMVVGIPDDDQISIGDAITVIGVGEDVAPTVAQLASQLGTIGYEICTEIAARVPRVYTKSGQIVAIDDLTGPREIPATRTYERGR